MIKPVPQDSNNWKMDDRGTEVYTHHYASVDDDEGVAISLPVDCKEVLLHFETGNNVATILGTIGGEDCTAAVITDGGTFFTLPIVAKAGVTLCTVYAPASQSTINVDVIAWR